MTDGLSVHADGMVCIAPLGGKVRRIAGMMAAPARYARVRSWEDAMMSRSSTLFVLAAEWPMPVVGAQRWWRPRPAACVRSQLLAVQPCGMFGHVRHGFGGRPVW